MNTNRARATPTIVTPETLTTVQQLYDHALYRQAWEASRNLGPLESWRGAAGRVLAGRLAGQLGAARLAYVLHLCAWREHPDDPEALYFGATSMHARRGPHFTLEFLESRRVLIERSDAQTLSSTCALMARLAALLRDFEQAERYLEQAEHAHPTNPWVFVQKGAVREILDDVPGALTMAERALSMRAWYRPAVESRTHCLVLLGRFDEARRWLEAANKHIESPSCNANLLRMYMDARDFASARAALERIEQLTPLRDKSYREWHAGRRADLAYQEGDIAQAITWARQAGAGFFARLAERLEQHTGSSQRVLLPVPFVRQHHLTCAPATLSSLAQFWEMPADHLEIAESICYDGTPEQAQREWAEQRGYVVREFTITWESGTALLDRGLPFTLSTVEPDSAHIQTVVGCDHRRRTFLVRDPSDHYLAEFDVEATLARYRAHGPRGMVLVPHARAALLDGVSLGDAAIYDKYYDLQTALLAHDRDRAAALADAIEAASPQHRLAALARRSLATYDGDENSKLRVTEALLACYPDDVALRMQRQVALARLGRRAERLAYLEEQCRDRSAHMLLQLAYAGLLGDDAREHDRALQLLNRCQGRLPYSAEVYYQTAHILWEQRRHERAMCFYRRAACLETTDERYADSYFKAARHLRQTDKAIAFLDNRVVRYGRKSSAPVTTLFDALDAIERTPQAFTALERALKLRPQDGDLLLFASERYTTIGRHDRAQELVGFAQSRVSRLQWLQSAARLAENQGRFSDALTYWREAAEASPFNLTAVRNVANLLSETQNRSAALEHLQRLAERFPHHVGIRRIHVEWLADEPAEIVEPVLRYLLEISPADDWAQRELAGQLARQRRFDAALEALDLADALAPHESANALARARILAQAGRRDDARSAYRNALQLSIDNDNAMFELLDLCSDIEERRNELTFMRSELIRQVTFGDGLLSYEQAARNVLDPEALHATLVEARSVRPDLWHAWIALGRYLSMHDRHDEALMVLSEASERFPLLPRVWLELAEVRRLRGEREAEKTALVQTLELSPGWGRPARALADLLQAGGELEAACVPLQNALAISPRDSLLHGWLGDLLWVREQHEAALQHLERAIRLNLEYLWAWNTFAERAGSLGQRERVQALAQALTNERPGDARAWVLLALAQRTSAAQCEEAFRKALAIAPRSTKTCEAYVDWLVEQARHKDALALLDNSTWRETSSTSLRLHHARIRATIDGREKGIEALQEFVKREPDRSEAWQQLADWYLGANRLDDYLVAARELVRLRPNDHIAHGYAADGLLRKNERAEAKRHLERAIQLLPSYVWGLRQLFQLRLEQKELSEAEAMLPLFERHAADALAALSALRLATARGDRDGAEQALRRLCLCSDADNDLLDAAVDIYVTAGWVRLLNRTMREMIETDGCHAAVGYAWGEHLSTTRSWLRGLPALQRALRHQREVGALFAGRFLKYMGDRKHARSLLLYLRWRGSLLRRHLHTWAMAGYALTGAGCYRATARWLHDWRERENIESWMLFNLVISLRHVGRDREAHAISSHALTLARDNATCDHRLLLALDAGLQQDVATLIALHDAVDPSELNADCRFVFRLLEALRITLDREPSVDTRREIRERIRVARSTFPSFFNDSFTRRAYLRVLWCIAGTQRRHWLTRVLLWIVL